MMCHHPYINIVLLEPEWDASLDTIISELIALVHNTDTPIHLITNYFFRYILTAYNKEKKSIRDSKICRRSV
jgi:hypothetical protein